MFKKNFIKFCNQIGEAPTTVCVKVGLTKATFTHWNETTVPRETTLYKIADYLGVTVEQMLAEDEPKIEEKEKATVEGQTKAEEFGKMFPQLTEEEQAIINAQMEFMLSKRGKK